MLAATLLEFEEKNASRVSSAETRRLLRGRFLTLRLTAKKKDNNNVTMWFVSSFQYFCKNFGSYCSKLKDNLVEEVRLTPFMYMLGKKFSERQ